MRGWAGLARESELINCSVVAWRVAPCDHHWRSRRNCSSTYHSSRVLTFCWSLLGLLLAFGFRPGSDLLSNGLNTEAYPHRHSTSSFVTVLVFFCVTCTRTGCLWLRLNFDWITGEIKFVLLKVESGKHIVTGNDE
jgi:hypothetical protein